MAGAPGVEPGKWQSQSLLPYRLAMPQFLKEEMVERGRFELPNPMGIELQSTAFSHFATSPKKMVPTIGIEPTTYWLQIS